MGLTNVWLRTVSDGLIRADQVIGIVIHRTPVIAGKPSHWLFDVVLPTTTGSGATDTWTSEPLHRTMAQTGREPTRAPEALARLLAQLDAINATGLIVTHLMRTRRRVGDADALLEPDDGALQFQFIPFARSEPERQHDPRHDDQYI